MFDSSRETVSGYFCITESFKEPFAEVNVVLPHLSLMDDHLRARTYLMYAKESYLNIFLPTSPVAARTFCGHHVYIQINFPIPLREFN